MMTKTSLFSFKRYHSVWFMGLLSCIQTEAYEQRWSEIRDFDQDGISIEEGDCNDYDAMISPEAAEICDEIDNNCNGIVDEDALNKRLWGLDLDLDGYAAEAIEEKCFQDNPQLIAVFGDCDDADPLRFPEANETWQDAFVDNDCDLEIEKISYNLDEYVIPFEAFGTVEPIILNDFEILKIAMPINRERWLFHQIEGDSYRETDQAEIGTKGVGFQNQLGIEFLRGDEHWLAFYTELDILSQTQLSFSKPKIYLPKGELRYLEAAPDDEFLAVITGSFEENIVYIIETLPERDSDIDEVAKTLPYFGKVQAVGWSFWEDRTQIFLKIGEQDYLFFEKEDSEWQQVFAVKEACDGLIYVQNEEFICYFEQSASSYLLQGDEFTLQDSKMYETAISDILAMSINGKMEPFVILEQSDASDYISYSFQFDQIAMFTSKERELRKAAFLSFGGRKYFSYWDQLHKELLMVLMPSSG